MYTHICIGHYYVTYHQSYQIMPIIGGLCYLGNHVCMSHSISCLILLPTLLNIMYFDIYLFYIAAAKLSKVQYGSRKKYSQFIPSRVVAI